MSSLPSLLPAASSLLPGPQLIGGGWSRHHDGGSQFDSEELHYLQVFYCEPPYPPLLANKQSRAHFFLHVHICTDAVVAQIRRP